MQHRCDCHGFKGGHHLLSVSNCNPVPEASWATMVTRRSRCLWTPSKAKSTSKMWNLMEQCRLQWPYIIRIHPQGHLQVHPCKDTIQHKWIWTDLFQNNGCKKPASQRNKPTKQLQPRDDLQTHFPGFFRFGCLLPSKDSRGWLWMAYSPISCFPHRALLELAEHQRCWIQVIHGLSQLLMSEANERFTSAIIW